MTARMRVTKAAAPATSANMAPCPPINLVAELDAEKLNQGFIVFCNVKMSRLSREIAQNFTQIIRDIPEVTECYNISGSFDYLLKIHAPNMKYYLVTSMLA